MMRVLYVVGTRPEFVRSAHILHDLSMQKEVNLAVLHTGQHYDHNMSGGFFDRLALPEPRYFLQCGARSRAEQVTCVITGVVDAIGEQEPHCVCVFGDTNTSLGGCLGAVTADVPVVHIEAGARSGDMTMPEEVNRRLIDHSSDLLLAVSHNCVENLRREAVPGHIVDVGDPLFEVFAESMAMLPARVASESCRRKILLTVHRQGLVNVPKALKAVLSSIARFAEEHDMEVIFPVHPRTAAVIRRDFADIADRISLCEPFLYLDLLSILRDCSLVVTDSGGLQKEAFWAGKPCVTVRSTTEWGETVALGANVLAVGDDIAYAAKQMLRVRLSPPSEADDPYHGRGASARVVDALLTRYAR